MGTLVGTAWQAWVGTLEHCSLGTGWQEGTDTEKHFLAGTAEHCWLGTVRHWVLVTVWHRGTVMVRGVGVQVVVGKSNLHI